MNNKTIDRILIGSISTLSVMIVILVILILREANPVDYNDIPEQTEVLEESMMEEVESETVEPETEEKKKLVEVTTRVNIRGTDSEDGKVLETVEAGATFDFVEVLGNGWTHILYDGQDAYVNSKYVKLVDANPEKKEE